MSIVDYLARWLRRMKNTDFCPKIYYTNLYLTLTRSWWFLLQLSGDDRGLRSDSIIFQAAWVEAVNVHACHSGRGRRGLGHPQTYRNAQNQLYMISPTWCHPHMINALQTWPLKLGINTRYYIGWRYDTISYNEYCELGWRYDTILRMNSYVPDYCNFVVIL